MFPFYYIYKKSFSEIYVHKTKWALQSWDEDKKLFVATTLFIDTYNKYHFQIEF